MIAQISSPLRALILLFTLVGSLYIFHPYTLSRSTFSFTDRTSNNATATEIPQSAPPAKAPEKASPPVTRPPAHNTPEIAKNHISGDLVDDPDEGGPRVRQATMVYETERFNAIYERSIDTHIKHGEQWGVPTHILRHDIVEAGFFNKPAYILGLIIEEMAKPYGKRAGWIVYVSFSVSLFLGVAFSSRYMCDTDGLTQTQLSSTLPFLGRSSFPLPTLTTFTSLLLETSTVSMPAWQYSACTNGRYKCSPRPSPCANYDLTPTSNITTKGPFGG